MRKNNKWALGRVALAVPPLPAELRGASGCRFQDAIFDPKAGEEVYLAILDNGEYARGFASARPFNLSCTSGLVRTRNGVVGYLVWTIAAGSSSETQAEQFINPHDSSMIELISALAQQSHLKALIIDSDTDEVCGWFEFENNFGFSDFCGIIAQTIGQEPQGDFRAAVEEVIEKYTMADLLRAT